jgi:hypothetical protein
MYVGEEVQYKVPIAPIKMMTLARLASWVDVQGAKGTTREPVGRSYGNRAGLDGVELQNALNRPGRALEMDWSGWARWVGWIELDQRALARGPTVVQSISEPNYRRFNKRSLCR